METKRTKKEIDDKIKELISDSDNFTSDNYGSEAADNGIYELYYSEFASEITLNNFVKWLFEK
jgi:hypothetical protein